MNTTNENNGVSDLDIGSIVREACEGLEDVVSAEQILAETERNLYAGATEAERLAAVILAIRTKIEEDPAYSTVASRVVLSNLTKEINGARVARADMQSFYEAQLVKSLSAGVEAELLDTALFMFDIDRLSKALKAERDDQFGYLSMQTLYDRYFIHINKRRIELPQIFLMRVAMGLALNEEDRNGRAIEFYDLLSSADFMSSTPTLFNSGTRRSQLSSCYLSTVPDDLQGIYGVITENALLSKFAGGLGNDWTNVRALGSLIKGTNGESQGVVPFLKVVNDTAVAVNQGGKRKGAVCVFLESWHLDVEEFLELRKNTGDDRRRTHDMNTANWIPDLFMKRLMADSHWTLFSPSDVPHLHDLYGKAFEAAYVEAEAKTATGEIKLFKKIQAKDLWRKMLAMLFETGHPWITFKDPSNIRSPQQHAGVVHSSNLCVAPETKILTSEGYLPIVSLVNKQVNVWNGYEWSEVTVKKTGTQRRLVHVSTAKGHELHCTPDHKFYIANLETGKEDEVPAKELKPGMALKVPDLPVIPGAYEVSSDYEFKEAPSAKYTVGVRIRYLEKLAKSTGKVHPHGEGKSYSFSLEGEEVLEALQLMLQTLGVPSRQSPKVAGLQRNVVLTPHGLKKLVQLGFNPEGQDVFIPEGLEWGGEFDHIETMVDEGRKDDTYCFTEPKRHLGMFNGILTGQCTEITLNTSETETAVCNLGSINLGNHMVKQGDTYVLDEAKLRKTVRTAMRMLDNVIDINYYSVEKSRTSNLKHRPVGMGLMAFQDALYLQNIPYASQAAMEFADKSMEAIAYFAYEASSDLAVERGAYPSFEGSLWSKGILPLDTIQMLEEERGTPVQMDRSSTKDWDSLREKIKRQGMRNSNCLAIAPTATISNIVGCEASIEPNFQNLSVKSNLSGEFTVINKHLVAKLKELGLWNTGIKDYLKANDGNISRLEVIPQDVRNLFQTAFQVPAIWLVEAASRRQKWIDQAQSLNIYMAGASGKTLDETYKAAWTRGLKTTYYLRAISATQAEKSTIQTSTLNAVPQAVQASAPVEEPQPKFCSIEDPTCEACQ